MKKYAAWILLMLCLCIWTPRLWSESRETFPTKASDSWLYLLNSSPLLRQAVERILQEAREKAAAEAVAELQPVIARETSRAELWHKAAQVRQEKYEGERALRIRTEEGVAIWRAVALIGIPVAVLIGGIVGAVLF